MRFLARPRSIGEGCFRLGQSIRRGERVGILRNCGVEACLYYRVSTSRRIASLGVIADQLSSMTLGQANRRVRKKAALSSSTRTHPFADSTYTHLDIEALRGTMESLPALRVGRGYCASDRLVDFFVKEFQLSERASCALAGLSRTVRRYQIRTRSSPPLSTGSAAFTRGATGTRGTVRRRAVLRSTSRRRCWTARCGSRSRPQRLSLDDHKRRSRCRL